MNLDNPMLLFDFVTSDETGMVHMVKEMVAVKRSEFQKIQIVDTAAYGRILMLDDRVQSVQKDEFIYHESLVQPAMLSHPDPKSVLILGGGEGATLREVLRHPGVERVVMVDIDEELIRLGREHLPTWHQGAFDDPRTELLFTDGRAYVEQTDDRFDVMIFDLVEPIPDGPALFLYSVEFYRHARRLLNPGGIGEVQSDSPAVHRPEIWTQAVNTLKHAFGHVAPLAATIPSFGSLWGYTLVSNQPIELPSADDIDKRIAERGLELRFYDGATHRRLFSLPKYVRTALENEARFYSDERPPEF